MGQVNDWMNQIYPRWVAVHGVMIVSPVSWYQAPSVLKLMIDRLVCADPPAHSVDRHPSRAGAAEAAGALRIAVGDITAEMPVPPAPSSGRG